MEQEINLNEIIVVESLPKITQRLQIISDEIDKEISYALSLECNEDSKTEVKKARSRLNSIKSVMEDKRKQIKKAILTPYEEFEVIYDNLVKDKLNEAENTLKMRINAIEEEQIKIKTEELIEFSNEYIKNYGLEDFYSFEKMNVKITLSASIKSLKEKIIENCKKIQSDIMIIEKMPYKEEILYEYKNNGFSITLAIETVEKRKKALENEILEVMERKESREEETKNEEQIDTLLEELLPPKPIVEEEKFSVVFKVVDTLDKIKKLKEFMKENEIEFE